MSVHRNTVPTPDAQIDQSSLQDSTAPSSPIFGGSVSVGDPSTGKTSLESNVASLLSNKAASIVESLKDAIDVVPREELVREKSLSPIQELPPSPVPTLITVESAVNAKIFFETHFNSLLAGHATPRSVRRNELELCLQSALIPDEQRQQQRLTWLSYESENLRQTRILKSKINETYRSSGVAVAGYEVVRILGKGSFGVVRLVREKDARPIYHGNSRASSALTEFPLSPQSLEGRKEVVIPYGSLETPQATVSGQKRQKIHNENKSRKVYAMKVIRKSDMLRNCQEGHLRAERDFLVASESSRWIVPLIASFQDNTNLYLVMEYMVGGDFLGLLFRKDILKERHARWYTAEMILCVEEAHRLRWIHRDVKPDNFLISASGHLKISDFGLAFDGHWAHDQRYFKNHRLSLMEKLGIHVKGDSQDQDEDAVKEAKLNLSNVLGGRKGRHERPQLDGPSEHESILQWRNRYGKRRLAGSVVGTSQYMAPEVIRGDPYDGRCDWWSIGVILYECLYGFTPFVCEKREDTKAKILDNAKSLVFPDEREVDRREKVSYDAMELINSLLQEKEHRLCSKKYRFNDYQHSKRTPNRLEPKRADPLSQDYQGNYVYPDDASDIKGHAFFRHISWERLHLTRPPFVPDVNGSEDTKYFDEEEPISDVDDAASVSDAQEASDCQMSQVDGAQGLGDFDPDMRADRDVEQKGRDQAARVGEKKRPRDKVLRDKEMGKLALEIRKKGAFLGYDYRRPRLIAFEEERGRSGSAKSTVPSFQRSG